MPGLSGNSSSSQLAPMAEATQPCESGGITRALAFVTHPRPASLLLLLKQAGDMAQERQKDKARLLLRMNQSALLHSPSNHLRSPTHSGDCWHPLVEEVGLAQQLGQQQTS